MTRTPRARSVPAPLAWLVLAPAPLAAQASEPVLPVFLEDVQGQFGALALRPDGLAFGIGDSPDPRVCKHYQGMARVQGPDGTPYLFVSRSGNQPGGWGAISCPLEDDDPGNLLVVELGSRERHGERLRSNRFARDWPIDGGLVLGPTPPPAEDRVVTTISFDGGEWDDYAHPGGMQAIGDVLVLAQEAPYGAGVPENLFMFLDVSDPASPTLLSSWSPPDPGDDFSAGLVGIAPIRNPLGPGVNYVLVAAGKKNEQLRFFLSLPTAADGSTDLRSDQLAWIETARFSEAEIEACLNIGAPVPPPPLYVPIDWHTGSGDAHQMLNLLREGDLDGPLYMLGARNDTPFPSGEDRMDLYRIHLTPQGYPQSCFIELVQTRHFTSYPFMGGGDSANFAAASGTYVSPSGELIVYSAEYENDGPYELGGGDRTVRFGEYRHRDMVRPGSPTLRPTVAVAPAWDVDEGSALALSAGGQQALTQAWIQLYEDDDAGASLPAFYDGDMWLAIDLRDRDADDFDDFTKLDFWNQAGSWRWFAPVGCTIRANDYEVAGGVPPGPDTRYLEGTDAVVLEPDLDSIGFDDDLGSVTFLEDCVDYYAAPIGVEWDLDGNGVFESSGTSVAFDAGLLDGPSVSTLAARARHPQTLSALGVGLTAPVQVTVHNVPPLLVSLEAAGALGQPLLGGLSVSLPGLPVTLSARFTDPGRADRQSAVVAWGDGWVDATFDVFSDAFGGALGVLEHAHVYLAAGDYAIHLDLVDDDGGATPSSVGVEVLSAEAALWRVADALAAELATAGTAAPHLQATWSHLVGHAGGLAQDGALDKLAAGKPGAAITHMILALQSIADAQAASALDLSAHADLIGLTAEHLARAALAAGPKGGKAGKQTGNAQALIDQGHAALLAQQHVDACVAFRKAVNLLH